MSVDLEELKRLEAEATPGPWGIGSDHYAREVRAGDGDAVTFCGSFPEHRAQADARLIAAARNALPELLAAMAERDALRAENKKLRMVAEAAREHIGSPTPEGYHILRAPRPLIEALAALEPKP